ncbi:MAG: helix-turn-helix transcriptional regulator [Firmicutes bacterium]|nr:helix-turn-helix transcriptional regulator [Bacillota bacterium]MBR2576378.1 helix-turn-helix transcriptional regulator [Bacillota bacterium]
MNDNNQISTEELLRMLFLESSLDHLMKREGDSLTFPAFSEYISALCERRGEPPERVIKRADIEKSYGHQIFSGKRNPSRDTVLKLAFGFGMDYEQTQELLKVARKSLLHPKVKRDMVLVFCLHHHQTLVDTQIALQEYRLPLLGEGSKNE